MIRYIMYMYDILKNKEVGNVIGKPGKNEGILKEHFCLLLWLSGLVKQGTSQNHNFPKKSHTERSSLGLMMVRGRTCKGEGISHTTNMVTCQTTMQDRPESRQY